MFNMEHQKSTRLLDKLARELGSDIHTWLEDIEIKEIMLNADGELWFDHQVLGLIQSGKSMDPVQAFNLIGTLATLSGCLITTESPILECELPLYGSRFEAVIPPVTTHPIFCIRKHGRQVLSLQNYIEQGVMTHTQAELLRKAIINRKNIIVAGGPGTGKTTFLNALLNEMVKLTDPTQRVVILEETPELRCVAKNAIYLRTSAQVSFDDLLRATLRLRPDKICMGECRGREMLTLLKSWSTGTPGGLATIHANSARATMSRIHEMVAESGSQAHPQLLCEAVNIIVSLGFDPIHGRKLTDLVELRGYADQDFQLFSLIEGNLLCQNRPQNVIH